MSEEARNIEEERKNIQDLRRQEKSLVVKLEKITKEAIKKQEEEMKKKTFHDQYKEVTNGLSYPKSFRTSSTLLLKRNSTKRPTESSENREIRITLSLGE